MDFLLEITKIGKSLETFGSRIVFLRFLNPWAGMDFLMDFWLFEIYFINFIVWSYY